MVTINGGANTILENGYFLGMGYPTWIGKRWTGQRALL